MDYEHGKSKPMIDGKKFGTRKDKKVRLHKIHPRQDGYYWQTSKGRSKFRKLLEKISNRKFRNYKLDIGVKGGLHKKVFDLKWTLD